MSNEHFLKSNYSDYENSFSIYKSLLTTNYEIEAYPPSYAKSETFGKDFPGSLIRKPKYEGYSIKIDVTFMYNLIYFQHISCVLFQASFLHS